MSLTPEDATRLGECIVGDGVAVIPTDTVYGLACNPESETAVRRVYELKQRPPVRPSAVMFFALEPALESLTELGSRTRAALGVLLPGPVTLLLPNPEGRFPLACLPAPQGVCPSGCAPTGTRSGLLGLRIPLYSDRLTVLAAVGAPAAQSSANLSGEPAPRHLSDVPAALREGADLVLNGGELPGTASTVIDLSEYEPNGSWKIVREGPLDAASVTTALARSC